jgi:hypothetical protein
MRGLFREGRNKCKLTGISMPFTVAPGVEVHRMWPTRWFDDLERCEMVWAGYEASSVVIGLGD